MKSFLEAWLSESQKLLGQELGGPATLTAAGQLPSPQQALWCVMELGGDIKGSFSVAADSQALAALLVAAKVTSPDPDAERDVQLWQGMLQQIAVKAASASGYVLSDGEQQITIRTAAARFGAPAAAYELRLGGSVVPLAFIDELHRKEAPAAPQEPAGQRSAPARAAAMPARSVELLLDVELEASLRFGSREMPLHDILELGPGDVVQLERHISDPVDLIVGDKIVARGEVVLVNGSFGLRVTEVAEPKLCLETIRCLF